MHFEKTVKPAISIIMYIYALIMWYIMFVLKPHNFWLTMSVTTGIMIIVAAIVGYPLFLRDELKFRNLSIGIISAFILYFIFWAGNEHIHLVMPDRIEQVQNIYSTKNELSSFKIGMLLFFPIGVGEELFWRGYLQKYFEKYIGRLTAFFIVLLAYTSVHFSSGNMILILASLVCGTFWGLMYFYTKSIIPGTISHMIWDPLIFVILPIQ